MQKGEIAMVVFFLLFLAKLLVIQDANSLDKNITAFFVQFIFGDGLYCPATFEVPYLVRHALMEILRREAVMIAHQLPLTKGTSEAKIISFWNGTKKQRNTILS